MVTGAEVFDATPHEFRRLGALVSLLDLAVMHGCVVSGRTDTVQLAGDRVTALLATLPHIVFDAPVPTKENE